METMFNDIARSIKENINDGVGASLIGIALELGDITPTGLKLDNFKHEIKDYMLLDYLTLKREYVTETACVHSHTHVIKTFDKILPIAPGDRVLVANVSGEFIVVGRIASDG